MIRNILFDMGSVLLRFEPETFVARLGLPADDARALTREVYRSADWVMLDRGAVDEEGALRAMCARLPERLHAAARELVLHWDSPKLLPVPGMYEVVEELSANGYGLYLLSNAGLRHHQYWPGLPVSRFFGDRLMISADWQLLKPEAAFYEKAFAMFGLDRRECVFIDDNPVNAEAAIRLGLDTIVFYGDPPLLRRRLREKGVDISQ